MALEMFVTISKTFIPNPLTAIHVFSGYFNVINNSMFVHLSTTCM